MTSEETILLPDQSPSRGIGRRFVLYVLLPGLPLLLFFILWRVALANAGIVLQSAVSPDGIYIAESIRRDPGGDSSFDYYVRLRRTSSRIVDPLLGNAYRAFDQGGSIGEVQLLWTGNSSLTIQCRGCSGYRVGGDSWRGVQLKYEIQDSAK
jgi:hypothetical protein